MRQRIISICSHSLLLIDGPHNALSFGASLPDNSMPDRMKICTDLADAFNNPGFSPDLSFHKVLVRQFLYPSKEDLYGMVRFLVGKLSGSSGAQTAPCGDYVQNGRILNGFNDMGLRNEELEPSSPSAAKPNSVLNNVEIRVKNLKLLYKIQDLVKVVGRIICIHQKGSKAPEIMVFEFNMNNEEVLEKLRAAKYSELEHPDEELQLLKMVLDGQHHVEFYIEELNEQVETKRHNLKEMESEWDAIKQPLQEKKINREQSMFACHPEPSGELKRMN